MCWRVVAAALLLTTTLSCAGHAPPQSTADPATPHVTWQLRSEQRDKDTLLCASGKPSSCVVTASTDHRQTAVSVQVALYSGTVETKYLGTVLAPFLEGGVNARIAEVTVSVSAGAEPLNSSLLSAVTHTPGTYELRIALDAFQDGRLPTRIDETIPVIVQ